MSTDPADNIRQVARLLSEAQRVCCLTGAGVSAESGIPTFRGHGGLWEGRRPEEVASPEAFQDDPEQVWRFYLWRRKKFSDCKPNAGHFALARLEELIPDFTLVTQNIDNLHQNAGSRRVIELHGNIWINRCTGHSRPAGQPRCPETRATADDGFDDIPHCPACGSMMRPAVVWFGEMLPSDEFAEAVAAARDCQVMLVVGTSAVVHPAASIATWAADSGATLVEVNPNATPLSGGADCCLAGPSGEILPAVVEQMTKRMT
jgi:NAD-dependent deacetylase